MRSMVTSALLVTPANCTLTFSRFTVDGGMEHSKAVADSRLTPLHIVEPVSGDTPQQACASGA